MRSILAAYYISDVFIRFYIFGGLKQTTRRSTVDEEVPGLFSGDLPGNGDWRSSIGRGMVFMCMLTWLDLIGNEIWILILPVVSVAENKHSPMHVPILYMHADMAGPDWERNMDFNFPRSQCGREQAQSHACPNIVCTVANHMPYYSQNPRTPVSASSY
jgi:hypothetical protein